MIFDRPDPARRPAAAIVCLMACWTTACAGGAHPVLDGRILLDRQTWWDNRDLDWFEERVPVLDSPDSAIDATYYYRWEIVARHLTYGSPESGYTFTEFLDRPFWSGAYGAISCPLGHQLYEVRWLKDRRILEDFARYWFETPGAQPRSYSNWYGDAIWAAFLVLGDTTFLRDMLPHMETQHEGWMVERFDSVHGLFAWDGLHDGMEVNINSRLTDDEQTGAVGYRPTLNSYLYADRLAISRAAALLGDSARSRAYAEAAETLKQRVQEELWDPGREFFLHQFANDEKDGIRARTRTYESGPYAGNPHGRELIGYVPWQFNLPDPGYEAAWKYLMDPEFFFAPFGPTTVERNDPQFLISPECCVWSGNSWPYATTQTLVALANLLNNYEQPYVTRGDYVRLLQVYARTHTKDGRPYIAEAAHPDNGSWKGHDTFYHSEHYFHSGFADLVITGLAGLRPRADDVLEVNPLIPEEWPWFALDGVGYHGHRISVVWDRDGSRYGRGAGLTVFADGEVVAHSGRIQRLEARLEPRVPVAPKPRMHNLAVNNGRGAYPLVTASYSAPASPPTYLTDGNSWYDESPPNRWTSLGSGNAEDTLLLDFGVPRPVEVVKLYFLDDGDEIAAPAGYRLQWWRNGRWADVTGDRRTPAEPEGRRANIVELEGIVTPRLRVVLEHASGSSSGLTELEAWAHSDLPLPSPETPSRNIAFAMPTAASFTGSSDSVEDVNDMEVAFSRYSRNRWTAFGTPNPTDWLMIDFGQPRRVRQLDLYLWGDDRGVSAPRSLTVQYRDGTGWRDATVELRRPESPATRAVNVVRIASVETSAVRVVLEHDQPAVSGVTEIMIWPDIP